jgi:hypothetical protein
MKAMAGWKYGRRLGDYRGWAPELLGEMLLEVGGERLRRALGE